MRFINSFLLIISILFYASPKLLGQSEFPANDPNISVMGRTLENAAGDIVFDWPGVTIHTGFSGTSCVLKISDTKENFYNVFVDDKPLKVIGVKGDSEVTVAKNLPAGDHTLKIIKRTEGNQGKAIFKGIVLDQGASLKKVTRVYDHKIEFIGNSITCGYGVEGKSKEEKFMAETENNYKSYAAITARAFNAEYQMIAHSGQGIVRNYGDENMTSDYTMPDRYQQVFDMEKEPLWDFSKWRPDAVVINLGTNDFSTEPHPIETVFNRKYTHLIKFIRDKYGTVPVFCIVGPMIDEPCYSYVKKMVDANRTHLNDPDIYFIGIPKYLMIEDQDLGSSWHPNYSGQKKMAELIVPVISSVNGWSYGEIR